MPGDCAILIAMISDLQAIADLVLTDEELRAVEKNGSLLVVAPDDTVTDVAVRMTERDLPYAAVDIGDGQFGLVTDEAMRRLVMVVAMPCWMLW